MEITKMAIQVCKYILLVEDDEDLRQQMAEVLRDEGYRVVTSENGKVALEYLLSCKPEDRPSCIILDLMMPVMTGGEFLKKIQAEHSDDLAKIPVIVATAKGSPKEELMGLPSHIGKIRKPMDIEELMKTVLTHCGEPHPQS